MTRVNTYEELEDLSIRLYGTAEGIVALMKANALTLDDDLVSNQLLSEPVFKAPASDADLIKPYVLPAPAMKATVVTFQNLTDIALQEFGTADALVQLCKLNGLALDADIVVGPLLTALPVRKSVKEYYANTRKKVITEITGLQNVNAILMEDGSYIFMEDGSNILLE